MALSIAFLCPSVSRAAGGIFEIERRLGHGFHALEQHVGVFGTQDRYTRHDLALWTPLVPEVFPFFGPDSFRFSPGLRRRFLGCGYDAAHLPSLWTYGSYLMTCWAAKWRHPYLVTLNGMIDEWAIRHSRWKKQLALALYENRSLRGAACIQVNSEAELQSARHFGIRNPLCVVPNGVEIEGNAEVTPPPARPTPARGKTLLYLGRLHPKKGLRNLLVAWADLQDRNHGCLAARNWVLEIAGWDQGGHEAELRNDVSALGIEDAVVFLGPRFGKDKSACFRRCDAFVLPSFSEGLPMAVLEAWSYAKPVAKTAACNLAVGFSVGAAVPLQASAEGIASGLRILLDMGDDERRVMGLRGLDLVKRQFTWPQVTRQLLSVYEWMLGGGPHPDCVRLT